MALESPREKSKGGGLALAWRAEVRGAARASAGGGGDVDGQGAGRRLAHSLGRGDADSVREAMALVARAVKWEICQGCSARTMDPVIHGLLTNVFVRPEFLGFLAQFMGGIYPKSNGRDARAWVMTELVRTVLLCLYADTRLDGERGALARACHEALSRVALHEGLPRLSKLLSGPAARGVASGPPVVRLVGMYHMVSEKHEALPHEDAKRLLRAYPGLASYVDAGRAGRALELLPPLAVHLSVLCTARREKEHYYEPCYDEDWLEWRSACETRFVAREGKNPLPALDEMIRRRGKSPQDARWREALLTGSFDQAVAEMAAWEALAGIPGARLVGARGTTDTARLDAGGAGCAVAIHAARNHLPFLGDTAYSTISPITQRHHGHVARRVRGEVLAAAARARRAARGGEPAIVVMDDSLGSVSELGAAESAMREAGAPDAVIVMRNGACRAHATGRRAREAGRICAAFAAALAAARSA